MLRTSACCVTLCALLASCSGDVLGVRGPSDDFTGVGDPSNGTGDGDVNGPVTSARVTLRRLTLSQYRNSMVDLLHVSPDLSQLTNIPPLNGLRAIGASSVALPERDVEAFVALAESVSAQVFSDPDARAALLGCDAQEPECGQEFVSSFGRRLFRRPLEDAERARYLSLLAEARETTGDGVSALRVVLSALLASPSFLYREETGTPHPDDAALRVLTPYELAARLSFFLWDSTPDDALLDAAEAGALDDSQGLRTQVERLLKSERAARASEQLFADYLRIDALDQLSKLPEVFPQASTSLFVAMGRETQTFLRALFERGADFREAFTSEFSFVNGELSTLYGLPAPGDASDFSQVQLPSEAGRAGILTQASFLASHAHPGASSATRRGKFVRESLLCQSMPPPPDDVDTSLPESDENARTARQRLTRHREDPACAGCHGLMDPIGLALENFDGIGAYRELEQGVTIDPSGELDGTPFDDAQGLAQALAQHPELTRCFVRTLLRYARGVLETEREQELVVGLDQGFADQGRSMSGLMRAIALDPTFGHVGVL